MGAFFTAILAKIVNLAKWVGLLVIAIFLGAWDLLRDLFCWVFDEMLTVAGNQLSQLDTSSLESASTAWGSLPGEVVNILGLLGVGDALAIIAAAIMIRLVLQLIPFTRLGS